MIKNKYSIILSISLLAYFLLSLEMVLWFDETMARNRDWAYLAGTTFGFIDEKWVFPSWVYAPWYHMICSYTFGPILFLFYKLDFISIRYAGTLTYQYANILIHFIGFLGILNFSKVLFLNKQQTNLFASLFLLFPFITKHTYQPAVEVLVVASFPWIFYYFLKIINYKKNFYKNLIKLSIIFGLSASSKISLLIPLIIFLFIFSFNFKFNFFFKDKKFILSLLTPLIFLIIFLFLSQILIGNWIWDNHDINNAKRGYGGVPPFEIFYQFDFFETFKAQIRQRDLKDSMLNFWLVDFFADQSQMSFARYELYQPSNYISFKYKVGIIITVIFIIYYLLNLIYFLNNSFKKLSMVDNNLYFRVMFVLSFFLIYPETVAYTYAVYSKTGGNWDLRYWSIYAFPMIFPIIYNLGLIQNFIIKRTSIYIIYFILLMSIFQRTNILVPFFE